MYAVYGITRDKRTRQDQEKNEYVNEWIEEEFFSLCFHGFLHTLDLDSRHNHHDNHIQTMLYIHVRNATCMHYPKMKIEKRHIHGVQTLDIVIKQMTYSLCRGLAFLHNPSDEIPEYIHFGRYILYSIYAWKSTDTRPFIHQRKHE
jgi:hypothetical protein